MSNFYIADTHFGHENIMRLCKRPYRSVDEMDETYIQNWNSVVTDNDTVYIVGDFCFRNAKKPEYYLERLNGHKVLILGNHDKNIKQNLVKGRYPGFDKVVPYLEIKDELNGELVDVVLSHYPMVEWNGYFRSSILLYGHIHNNVDNRAYQIMQDIPNAFNVGVDVLYATPRTLKEVVYYNRVFKDKHTKEWNSVMQLEEMKHIARQKIEKAENNITVHNLKGSLSF